MKKQPCDSSQNPYQVHYDDYLDTNACTECTGLMYRAPKGHEEWEAYQNIFDFTPVPKSPHTPDTE